MEALETLIESLNQATLVLIFAFLCMVSSMGYTVYITYQSTIERDRLIQSCNSTGYAYLGDNIAIECVVIQGGTKHE
jgi:hypothetical protein